jgi:hypothetical protein
MPAEAGRRAVGEVMDVIRAAAPDAGSYVNETDYHQPDWQRSFWGDNYARLLEIKHAYDPRQPVPRPPRGRQRTVRTPWLS